MNTPHDDFVTWYTAVDLGDTPKRIRTRASGTNNLVKNLNYELCLDLVDLVLDVPRALESAGIAEARGIFKNADNAFPTRGNDLEMKTLGEIALAILLASETPNSLAGRAATLICAAMAGGAREVASVTDIYSRACDAVQFQGRALRHRGSLPAAGKNYYPTLVVQGVLDGLDNLADPGQAKTAVERMVAKFNGALLQVSKKAREEREMLSQYMRVQDEELELLWWASNGHSHTHNMLFKDLAPPVRSLVAGVEAAARTQVVPGPSSILGLMERVGVGVDSQYSITEIVDGADSTWCQSIGKKDATERTPLHLAIEMKLQSPEPDTWCRHWSGITKIDSQAKRRGVEVAELFYLERLALGAYGEQK